MGLYTCHREGHSVSFDGVYRIQSGTANKEGSLAALGAGFLIKSSSLRYFQTVKCTGFACNLADNNACRGYGYRQCFHGFGFVSNGAR